MCIARDERRPLSPQVDLWGAATILYEALTNHRAIRGADNDQLQEALRATPPSTLTDYDGVLLASITIAAGSDAGGQVLVLPHK